jgi:hypothetical protein
MPEHILRFVVALRQVEVQVLCVRLLQNVVLIFYIQVQNKNCSC